GYGMVLVNQTELKMVTAGCIKLNKYEDQATRLRFIFDRLITLIDEYHPDELSIEAPFYGKNVQSMLKLGRAQGVAIAAALSRQIPYVEYAPRRIKQAITGNGASSKEQVSAMLKSILKNDQLPKELDATDGLAAAVCHHYSMTGIASMSSGGSKNWDSFIKQNSDRVIK
ncbi:MAG: crossover junction endodeoxyribonuclease RuvC, partial [Flavobacteriales bacterium]|nr:crossover junction endodeoxyribonuclease RuvC [Flavobacteriales bacterium]